MVSRAGFIVLCLLAARAPAQASDLGADGRLHFSPNALYRVDFEDPTATAAVVQQINVNGGYTYSVLNAQDLAPLLVTSNDALEGKSSFHLTTKNASGYAIVDSATFSTLSAQRITVSFWGRAEGMEPYLGVTYGAAVDLPSDARLAWAHTPAIRTGRETSDGWVEYSTGPIDGSVMGHPIHDLTITARVPTSYGTDLLLDAIGSDTAAFTMDAVEIVPASGAVASGSCSLMTADTDCAGSGECFYGQCVDAATVWNPVPPVAMQQEIVARVIHFITHFLGDRHAFNGLPSGWSSTTSALASATATPRSFWRGLNSQIVAVRDSHTRLGTPYQELFTAFFPRPYAQSGPLDVCFGPTLNDLGDGNLAFVVWHLGPSANAALKVGDVVTAIDGVDPKTWAELALSRYTDSLPIDSRADWAPASTLLATLIGSHAKTLTMTRCVGGTCTAQPPIDVASASLAATANGNYQFGTITCRARFTDLVSGDQEDDNGGDLLLSAAVDAATLGIELDGFSPSDLDTWKTSLDKAFQLTHTNVIVDARTGHGGYNDLGDYMMEQFRGADAPAFLALAARGAFDDTDPASLTSFDWTPCESYGSTYPCATADIFVYAPLSAVVPGEASKVAWLNTDDISNNDMVPLLLQGRANLRIFAPFPTYGAFGSDVSWPPLVPSWTTSYIAASDGRLGSTLSAAEAQPMCESGTGVVPDQVVTQTLSDVLAGNDTIIAAAKTWLGP